MDYEQFKKISCGLEPGDPGCYRCPTSGRFCAKFSGTDLSNITELPCEGYDPKSSAGCAYEF